MNQVVIFFVSVEATQNDLESALRKYFAQMQIGETTPRAKAAGVEITDNGQLPLWTWFIPNPCR